MSEEFKCIRKAYLFDMLHDEEQEKLVDYVESIFPSDFVKLIVILKKKYRVDKLNFFLIKFFKNLRNQFEKTRCYIETHKIYSNETLLKIETAIKKRFGIEHILFKYKVNENLLHGICFRINYKMYDLSLKNLIDHVKIQTLKRIDRLERV